MNKGLQKISEANRIICYFAVIALYLDIIIVFHLFINCALTVLFWHRNCAVDIQMVVN